MLKSLTPDIIKSCFPRAYYQRGYDYYREHRVENLKILETKKHQEEITAGVKGAQQVVYQVKVALSGPLSKPLIYGQCSCPMRVNCKHVVAVVLQAMVAAKQAAQPFESVPETVKKPFVDSLETKANFWLRQLDEVASKYSESETAIDETYTLYYFLKLPKYSPHELYLELGLVRRLKSGGLGVPKAFSSTSPTHRKHLYPVDKELLLKIEIATRLKHRNYFSNILLEGEDFEKILPDIVATERCAWVFEQEFLPVHLSNPKKAKFHWKKDTENYQQLICEVMDASGSAEIFSIYQLWYFDLEQRELGLLETGIDPKITKLLLSSPKISPDLIKKVDSIFLEHQQLEAVERPKIYAAEKTKILKPVPHLKLFQKTLISQSSFGQGLESVAMKQSLAELSFCYGDYCFFWQDPNETVKEIQDEAGELIECIRDKKAEIDARHQLIEQGLVLVSSVQSSHPFKNQSEYNPYFLVGFEDNDPLDFTLMLPKLRAAGWVIEISADYPYQLIEEPIDDWYSVIEEETGYDWFSLELGITVKGQRINLLPVLQQWIRKIKKTPDILQEQTGPILAQLDDGRFIPLPIERVRNIFNVLIELYDKDSLSADNILRLSKMQALRLLELEKAMGAAQLRWLGGDKLRRLANQLSDFKGIELIQAPVGFQGALRPYQIEGLSWMQFLRQYELNGVLADDMGLGKTVQTLAHLLLEKISGRMTLPCLVVAPTTLMFNWQMEAARFAPSLKTLILHGLQRKEQFDQLDQYDLIFTTYALVVRDKEILLKQGLHFLILDEAQFIKNAKSLAANIVQQLQARHRLCLTGTPLENHLGELWSLFHFLMPGLLGDQKTFNHYFRFPIEKAGDGERQALLNKRVAPFLLRRTKDKVVTELPEKITMIRHIELEGEQRDLYETIRVTMQKKVNDEIAKLGFARSHIVILDALLKLRQICCDPRLLKIETARQSAAESSKLNFLMNFLPELLEEGRRILLFSQFTSMLELIEVELQKQGITYVKLTGETKDRAKPVQDFQQGQVPLFLISLKAGGTGLNLTAADTVIHYDPWWNPAVENQATDRAHRIGQKKTVFVYKLVSKGTVEEKMLEMQERKSALMQQLFSGETTSQLKITEKDLQGLFDPLKTI